MILAMRGFWRGGCVEFGKGGERKIALGTISIDAIPYAPTGPVEVSLPIIAGALRLPCRLRWRRTVRPIQLSHTTTVQIEDSLFVELDFCCPERNNVLVDVVMGISYP